MQFGFFSVNLNSIVPVIPYMEKEHPDIFCHHYVDTGLQYLVKREGKVTENAILRLEEHLKRAVEDKSDAIVLTCTVFSPYIERIQKDLPEVPIICADRAMMEMAIGRGYDIAHIYTFAPSIGPSMEVFNEINDKFGSKVKSVPFFAENAFDSLCKGDRDTHDALIEEQIQKAEKSGFKTIVLSQMSMAYMKRESSYPDCVILSSPQGAVTTAIRIVNERSSK